MKETLNKYKRAVRLLTEAISWTKLEDIVLYYQKTVACEGFYYKEFTDKNPQMTARDRRMKTGWDFVEYMKKWATSSEL